jgi:hypothetical protein
MRFVGASLSSFTLAMMLGACGGSRGAGAASDAGSDATKDVAVDRSPHGGDSGSAVDARAEAGGEVSSTCGDSPVFADDFSAATAPGSGYTTINGAWLRAPGAYDARYPGGVAGDRAYALIDGDFGDFDVTVAGHSMGGDGFGLVYATSGVGDGYAVLVHPGDYDGLYFKGLVAGGGDLAIASATLPPHTPDAPFTLRVQRKAGQVDITLSSSAFSTPVKLSGVETKTGSAAALGRLGLIMSLTTSLTGVDFTDIDVASASCTSSSTNDGGDDLDSSVPGKDSGSPLKDSGGSLDARLTGDACSGAPTQASGAGYNCLAFDATFDTLSVSNTGTGAGYTWYNPGIWYQNPATGASTPTNAGDVLSLPWNPGQNSDSTSVGTMAANGLNNTSWTHGYFEISMSFPPVTGIWPGLWMESNSATTSYVPTSSSTHDFVELDIFEWQSQIPSTFNGHIHDWADGTDIQNNDSNSVATLPAGTNLADYNTYGVLWTSTEVVWYFNNQALFTAKASDYAETFGVMNASPMYLMISNGPGSNWGGSGSQSPTSEVVMKVQWVHVWQ